MTTDSRPSKTLYLQRNMLVCKAVGANANAKAALKRLKTQRRPAKWLIAMLEGIEERTAALPGELAHYRNLAPDNPYRDHKNPLGPREPPRPPNHREVA